MTGPKPDSSGGLLSGAPTLPFAKGVGRGFQPEVIVPRFLALPALLPSEAVPGIHSLHPDGGRNSPSRCILDRAAARDIVQRWFPLLLLLEKRSRSYRESRAYLQSELRHPHRWKEQ